MNENPMVDLTFNEHSIIMPKKQSQEMVPIGFRISEITKKKCKCEKRNESLLERLKTQGQQNEKCQTCKDDYRKVF